ncbi:MAG: hypothetical protein JST06_05740 [Bacteroidetes bacterium]|nr:hypothetical protein [Bacteroidota bacterium]
MKKFLIALLSLSFLTTGFAQAHNQSIRQRQQQQQRRIAHGINNGSLTPREAEHLENQQARIQSNKRMARADGKITRIERVQLNREQAHASRNIYALKHNNRRVR